MAQDSSQPAFVDPVYDMWMGEPLAAYLFGEVRHPNNSDEWLDYFEHLVTAYDRTNGQTSQEEVTYVRKDGKEVTTPLVGVAVSKLLTPAAKDLIRAMVNEGRPSPEIRAEVSRHFGVDISASHMSHLRRRLIPKATAL